MNRIIVSLLLIFLIASCGSDEAEKLDVYNTEAFAYDIGDGLWEVNASTRVKGFRQNENNNQFSASLSYEIDLVNPSGEKITSLISRTEDKSAQEKMSDTNLEVQFELDSTYSAGTYTIIFNVRDILSEQADTSSTEFDIEN